MTDKKHVVEELNKFVHDIKLLDYASIITYFNNRFGINLSEIISEKEYIKCNIKTKDQLTTTLLRDSVISAVLKNAANERNNYLTYCYNNNYFKNRENCIFVDIGHHGSLQKALVEIFNIESSLGLYFVTYKEVSQLRRIPGRHIAKGFLLNEEDPSNKSIPYCKYALLFEALFLNEEKSFRRIAFDNGNCQIETIEESNYQIRAKVTHRLHHGVVDFAKDLSRLTAWAGTLLSEVNHPDYSIERLVEIFKKPYARDIEVFKGIEFENVFSARENRFLVYKEGIPSINILWKETIPFTNSKKQITKKYNSISIYCSKILLKLFETFAVNLLSERKKNKLINRRKEFYTETNSNFLKYIYTISSSKV